MNESLRMVIVLSLIAILSGGSLALVDNATRERIAENKVKALNEALKTLIPKGDKFNQINIPTTANPITAFQAMAAEETVGWGFLLSGPGFQDKIEIVAATNREVTELLGIEILDQKETPGLGAEMVKPFFKKQFVGLSVSKDIGYIKNVKPDAGSNQVQALSAATISTEKLLIIINKNIKEIKTSEILQREEQ